MQRYSKIKVGRVSGYPIVVTQGKSEHDAILLEDDFVYEDPQEFLDRISSKTHRLALQQGPARKVILGEKEGQGLVEIRWTVAGYNDCVPVADVRLKPPEDGGWTTRGGAKRGAIDDDDKVEAEVVVGGDKKRKAGETNSVGGTEEGLKPEAAVSNIAVKEEEYTADTDDEEDGQNASSNTTNGTTTVKKEEYTAETYEEDGLKPEAVRSSVVVKTEEYAEDTEDARDQGDARQKVNSSSDNPDDAVLLKFFQKLNSLLEEQCGELDDEIKEMIEKNPSLLDAKCPDEDIKWGKSNPEKEKELLYEQGCTASEATCLYAYEYESSLILYELVCLGAKGTDRCFWDMNMRFFDSPYYHFTNFFIILLLSGYFPVKMRRDDVDEEASISSDDEGISHYALDIFVEVLYDVKFEEYEDVSPIFLDLLSILHKTVKLGDRLSEPENRIVNSIIADNINRLPQLEAGVTHEKDGPMDDLMKRFPIEKVRAFNEMMRENATYQWSRSLYDWAETSLYTLPVPSRIYWKRDSPDKAWGGHY